MTHIEQAFVETYEAAYVDLVRYVARRSDPDRAEDIAAEAFAVAWRRREDLPRDPEQARAWLFGIARRLLLADHRQKGREQQVRIADANDLVIGEAGHEDVVIGALDLRSAWVQLTPGDQDVLSLTAWERLSSAQAAQVLGISSVAYRIRLSRARRNLRKLMAVNVVDPPGASLVQRQGQTS